MPAQSPLGMLASGAGTSIANGSVRSNLAAQNLGLRQRYGDPVIFQDEAINNDDNPNAVVQTRKAPFPAKYRIPTEADEQLAAKYAVKNATNAQRTMPITQEEIDRVIEADRLREHTRFDRYVNMEKPMDKEFNWLMEEYPDLIMSVVGQAKDDYDIAIKAQLIKMFGAQTIEDLVFQYNVDQGYITVPELRTSHNPGKFYTMAGLSPWNLINRQTSDDLFVPGYKFGRSNGLRASMRPGPFAVDQGSRYPTADAASKFQLRATDISTLTEKAVVARRDEARGAAFTP